MKTHNIGRFTVALVLAGAGILHGCAGSKHDGMHRSGRSSMEEPTAKMNLSDANIVALLAMTNQSDIEGGQLAEIKAGSRDVRSYGSRMISDHASMLRQGTKLSKEMMINPITPALGQQMQSEHEKSMEAFKKKSGTEFDRAYIEHEIQMHQKAIRLVEQAVSAADDPQLRKLLEESKPALEDHLEQAKKIKRALTASR